MQHSRTIQKSPQDIKIGTLNIVTFSYNKYCTLRKAIITFVGVQPSYYVVPEHTYTLPIDAEHWKFRGGGGTKKPKFLNTSMELNWNFWRGQEKSILGVGVRGEYRYFLEPHILAGKWLLLEICMGYNLPSWACNLLLIGFKFPGGRGEGEVLAIEKRRTKQFL